MNMKLLQTVSVLLLTLTSILLGYALAQGNTAYVFLNLSSIILNIFIIFNNN